MTQYAIIEFDQRKGEFGRATAIFVKKEEAETEMKRQIKEDRTKTIMVLDFPTVEHLQAFINKKPKGDIATIQVLMKPMLIHYGNPHNDDVFGRAV